MTDYELKEEIKDIIYFEMYGGEEGLLGHEEAAQAIMELVKKERPQ